jgi:hypothetical protein
MKSASLSANFVADDATRQAASDGSQARIGNRRTSRGPQTRAYRGIASLFAHGTAGRQARDEK